MSTIFADKFKNTSGGNNVKVNQLSGIDTAGSITIQGEGSATTNMQQGLAKVWVNFNGTGTIASRDSFNIASLTDTSTGNYVPNFSNNMSNNDYSATGGISESGVGGQSRIVLGDGYTTSSVTVLTANSATLTDYAFIATSIHGDLA